MFGSGEGMKRIYITVDENNRIQGWGDIRSVESEIEIEVDDNHEVLRNPFIFRYENGELIKDVEYQQQLIEERQRRDSQPSLEEELQKELAKLKKINADLSFELLRKGVVL